MDLSYITYLFTYKKGALLRKQLSFLSRKTSSIFGLETEFLSTYIMMPWLVHAQTTGLTLRTHHILGRQCYTQQLS